MKNINFKVETTTKHLELIVRYKNLIGRELNGVLPAVEIDQFHKGLLNYLYDLKHTADYLLGKLDINLYQLKALADSGEISMSECFCQVRATAYETNVALTQNVTNIYSAYVEYYKGVVESNSAIAEYLEKPEFILDYFGETNFFTIKRVRTVANTDNLTYSLLECLTQKSPKQEDAYRVFKLA